MKHPKSAAKPGALGANARPGQPGQESAQLVACMKNPATPKCARGWPEITANEAERRSESGLRTRLTSERAASREVLRKFCRW